MAPAAAAAAAPPRAAKKQQHRPSLRARAHRLLASEPLQSSIQIGIGMLVSTLFTYILPISFPPMSCVVATWFCVAGVMAAPSNHVGVRINAAASITGSTALGCVLAATQVSLARLAGAVGSPAYTATNAAIAAVFFVPLSINRVAALPPGLWAEGMNAALSMGLLALMAYSQQTVAGVWHMAGTLLLSTVIACVVSVLTAVFILPTHATSEVQESIAYTLLASGQATSHYAARLFRPLWGNTGSSSSSPQAPSKGDAGPAAAAGAGSTGSGEQTAGEGSADITIVDAPAAAGKPVLGQQQPPQQPSAADAAFLAAAAKAAAAGDTAAQQDRSYHLGEAGAALVMSDFQTEEGWLRTIERNSAPQPAPAPSAYVCPVARPPVFTLRPRLLRAQTFFLAAAAVEPTVLRGGWASLAGSPGAFVFDAPAWGEVAALLQVLLTRLSALEAVIEDGESLHTDAAPGFSPLLLSRMQSIYSTAATSLARMAHGVRAYGPHHTSSSSSSHGGAGRSRSGKSSSGGCQASNVSATTTAPALPEQQPQPQHKAPCSSDDRSGPDSKQVFCSSVSAFCHSWGAAKADLAALMRADVHQHWSEVMAAAEDSPLVLPTLTAVRHCMAAWLLTTAVVDTLEQLELAMERALCCSSSSSSGGGRRALRPLLWRTFGWLRPASVSGALLCTNQASNVVRVLGADLPAELRRGWAGVRSLAANRVVQAGLKFWLVVYSVYLGTLMLQHGAPALRSVNTGFGVVAASLTMSEKVEATFTKFLFQLFGTLIGGVIGWAAMLHPALALNPVGLAAVLTGFALVVGLAGKTRARVTVTLALMTISALVLCQCCGRVGLNVTAIARVASVLAGLTVSILVSNLLLPWYNSASALQSMSDVFAAATQVMQQMYAQHYAAGATAAAAFQARCPQQQPPGSSGSAQPSGTAAGDDAGAFGGAGGGEELMAAEAASLDVAAAAGAGGAVAQQAISGLPCAPACPLDITPAVLQSLLTRPLVQVQTALGRDAVSWQRGVLATPPVVPALLGALFSLVNRLAALQLALHPPVLTGSLTGYAYLHYGVPQAPGMCRLLQLVGELPLAVAAVIQDPSCKNADAVRELVARIAAHRVTLYTQMVRLRQKLHAEVLQISAAGGQQQQQAADAAGAAADEDHCGCATRRRLAQLLGGTDDVVVFMSFQFSAIKACDRLLAVARVAADDACRGRSTAASMLR